MTRAGPYQLDKLEAFYQLLLVFLYLNVPNIRHVAGVTLSFGNQAVDHTA